MIKNGKLSNFLDFAKSQSDRGPKTLPLSETQRRKDAETTERKKQQKNMMLEFVLVPLSSLSFLSSPCRPYRLSQRRKDNRDAETTERKQQQKYDARLSSRLSSLSHLSRLSRISAPSLLSLCVSLVSPVSLPPLCYLSASLSSLSESLPASHALHQQPNTFINMHTNIKKKPNPYRIRLEEAATYSPT